MHRGSFCFSRRGHLMHNTPFRNAARRDPHAKGELRVWVQEELPWSPSHERVGPWPLFGWVLSHERMAERNSLHFHRMQRDEWHLVLQKEEIDTFRLFSVLSVGG